MASFIYAEEPYGEGLFTTVNNLASVAKQGYRINGIGITYMPNNYNLTLAAAKCQQVIQAKNRFLFIAMTTDQATKLMSEMEKAGLLYTTEYQLIGSEAVKDGSAIPKPTNGLPKGFIKFNPVNKGTLFPQFETMWKKMLANDVTGAAATTRYQLDKFKVALGAGDAAAPTDALFTDLSKFQLEDPFIFDACYAFAIAFSDMLNEGVAAADIKGSALLAKVRASNFQGISGTVAFNDCRKI